MASPNRRSASEAEAEGDGATARLAPAPPVTVAVLVKRFPRLSETFVLNEFLELRRQGVPTRLVAIIDPREKSTQPEAERLRPEVSYLRASPWLLLVPRLVGIALSHPAWTVRGLWWAAAPGKAATWRGLAESLLLLNVVGGGDEVHLHAHFAHDPTAAAYLAHRMCGVSFSFTAHAKDLYTTPVADICERARAATFVATCTEANRRYLEQVVGVAPGRVRVCRHGVDLDRFGTIERRPIPGRLLTIGRLVPKKGFDVLIRACRLLADRGLPFDCRIIGDGPLRDELVRLTKALRLSEQVHIQPGGPQIELLAAYAEAEIFVLAPVVQANGDRDGVPNVIQEALAAGIPVVTSAISGIPEVVRDGLNGRLVEPGDPAALADALEDLLNNSDLRAWFGRAAAKLAADELDLSSCAQPLAEAFRLALAGASVPSVLDGTGSGGCR